MSKKASTYFPNYRLLRKKDRVSQNTIIFEHAGIYFTTKTPLLGATETQKIAMKWAELETPPVICVRHEAPTAPDKEVFAYPGQDLHIHIFPYAMVVATLEGLGEDKPRRIKIYFCDQELHEDNAHRHAHTRTKGTHVEAL